ncbi:disease resistance protein RPV1-like isoform X2 [Rhododendron vialii]|uniref:disease resistance protein RPV1-like isoform X2 n=1 Tax=Rhododendron vialii TaxID=182163 RepID=UPI00265EBA53|nr:disease resistance protein RPV1-like isoform X2 [Rhododendron vialii]
MIYHVFLSFRGEDTRKTFTDHLYTALSDAGFRTFRDDDGIERGKNVKSELDKAIKEARCSIVVLSKDYSSSGWCLDELVMILKRKRTSSGAGHVVLPVFYDVDPSEVRKQTGSFGKAFGRHEERLNAETNESKKEYLRQKVQLWRGALREVADLAGMVLKNQADGHESKFIQKIVRVIRDQLNQPVLHVAHHLIGIESQVRDINSWLLDESNVRIAVIYGMGGIGKTTIATFAYNLNVERFQASSFLANIREISEGREGLVHLQTQLLSDILKRKNEKIRSVAEGIIKLKDAISCKRVLVVLDDVDDRAQFDALIGMRDWFHPGSKIILTTRNIRLLKANEVDESFEVVGLDFDESLELFSWHAFGQDHPIEGYTELSQRVVLHCGGVPLALQVLGSSLSDHSLDVWKNTLQKLAAIPNAKILEKLQISYDYLDYNDKQLFLHIACFFIGKGKDFVVRILDDLYPTVGIQTLIDRCLLTINGHNKLMMHQLLQQMGREIVCQESPKEPGKRSRLWHYKDSFKVLSEEIGTDTIEGLYLDMHHVLEEDSHYVLQTDTRLRENFGFSNVKCPCFEELNHESLSSEQGYSLIQRFLSLFIWCSRSSDQVGLRTDAFTRMHNLKYLQLNNVEIKGRYTNFPEGLRCLTWHGFPLTSIPTEFSLKRLVSLDLRYSKLEQVWKGEMFLTSLKILNLSHSNGLKNTPKFTGLPNLEKLVLKYCISLVEVHESIGELESLVLLNLTGCENLKKLPSEIGHLTSLEKLILSGCSKLDQLPAELGQMKSITVLHADGISQDIGEEGSRTSLVWSLVLKPGKSPKTLPSLPGSLVELSLSNCNLSSDDLAKCLGSLSVLKDLDLSGNPISSLPVSIKGLAGLQSLNLSYCSRLRSLPELPMSLQELYASDCRSLKTITNLPNLLRSLSLDIEGSKVVEVQGMFKLEPIGNVDAEIINEMGLSSELEAMGSLEVEFYSPLHAGESVMKGPLQVLHECGIYNIFLPRSEVPAGWCSSCYKRTGSSITFNVSSLPNLKIQALKIYVVFACLHCRNYGYSFDNITLNNVTKGLKWAYSPLFSLIQRDNGMIVWLSHWKIGNQIILEAGDEVNVSAGSAKDWWLVEEIGVDIVYDEPEEKGSQHHKAYTRHQNVTNVGDLPEYQLTPGYYHLCHFGNHRKYHQYGSVNFGPAEKIIFFEESEDIAVRRWVAHKERVRLTFEDSASCTDKGELFAHIERHRRIYNKEKYSSFTNEEFDEESASFTKEEFDVESASFSFTNEEFDEESASFTNEEESASFTNEE